ncbi:MAG: DNA polymerase I [Acidobacteriota bacterium]
MKENLIMLVDGNSLVYRAFFALPLLRTKKGAFTNAIYGFLNMLFRVIKDFDPEYLVIAFDKSRITLRTQDYAEYKAHRSPTPPELREQFITLKAVLTALDITYIEMEGYEADDILGTLSCQARAKNIPCIILTGDQDALQLTGNGVDVLLTKKGISETERYSDELVMEKWEVFPQRLIDVKGLMGDASDNIPGVPGIGKKTAIKLVRDFGPMEELYEKLEQVTPQRIRDLLNEHKEQAFLSRSLATIITDLEIPFEFADYRYDQPQKAKLLDLYQDLEFNSFAKELANQNAEQSPVEIHPFGELLDSVQAGDTLNLYFISDQHHPMWGKVTAIHIFWRDNSYILPEPEIETARHVLENSSIKKYLHNAKNAQVLLARHGIRLDGVAGDTLLLSYVVDPSFQGESLQEHLFHYWGRVIEEASAPARAAAEIKNFHDFLMEKADAEIIKLYAELELPLSFVLGEMELAGIKVDGLTLEAISKELGERLDLTERSIYEMAGEEFNINSTRQLGQILFEKLGLPATKKTKTGYSTNADVLEQLYDAHPIIALIMDYRSLSKLKSTYVDSLQQCIHPDTGRVHTIFKQAVTATGRLSSVEPNLQNIPIRMEEGRRIRKAFIAPDQDWLLISADYSQIDLRVLAHVSGDETLIDTFKKGVDIHTRTASEIFHVPLNQVTGELRRRAKAVNFGIVYGISDFGLARDTGVSRIEAREYIANYLDSYPGVREYMRSIVEFGRDHGYVSTVLSRRRYLPDLLSSNRMVLSFAERMALNTPIQGTSADIIKLAMLDVDRELKRWELKSRMLLQVHDELVLEVPAQELDHVARLVKDCMENAFHLKVPLEAAVKVGLDWYDMHSWEG